MESLTMTGRARAPLLSSTMSFGHTRRPPTKASLTHTVAGKTYLLVTHMSTIAETSISSKAPGKSCTCPLK